ncbi:putative undecaprenyl-phosphate N-acetylglucosaminyl 1-phosphate transferase [Luteitalea pratensis]|uniref:Putative undecaprenyl-phosphate N-acetylglucosaminyl 1-phosphate transferase n=1 Tax=Luteitalea pratensis TaxID=1855912 RepID=A0A143PSK9_LUTPR|nr:glycosyltransferase family 4 protein [Luteitalea pratensis]AMY11717.1 putative undecaprenyl-phosphate N-acetylglucosaminyl 1-phosphate transferase [Luteitalea pratensis]
MIAAVLLGAGVIAALLTATLVEVVRRMSLALALLDHPNHRSSHATPTPRLGGVGLAVVLLAGLSIVAASPVATSSEARGLWAIVAIGAAIALVSFVDDVRSVGASVRLGVHLLTAVVLVGLIGGVRVVDLGPLGSMSLPVAAGATVMVLWVAWFINAFNFMDGSDGIAGVQAAVAGVSWVMFGLQQGSVALQACGVVLLGAVAGFLFHNWSPARIFMGDAGSALLGFLLATVPWVLGGDRLWLPTVLVLWPFLFDTLTTLAWRSSKGERIWEAHRSHLYQRLIVGGWTHRAVAMLYGALAGVGLAAALSLTVAGRTGVLMTASCLVVAAVTLWILATRAVSPPAAG